MSVVHRFVVSHRVKSVYIACEIHPYLRLKECGLTTLEIRRLRGHQIEVSKILIGIKILTEIFFSLKKTIEQEMHSLKKCQKQAH